MRLLPARILVFLTRLACALPVLGVGCSVGSSGALDQTSTNAACPPSDLVCATSGIDAPIAKGATLAIDVTVTSEGSATPPLSFESGNPAVFTVEDSRIVGKAPGLASMLILTEGNLVVDFLHVWIAEADAMRLHRVTQAGLETSPLPASMQVLVDDELMLVAAPHRGAQRLLGDLDATFDADPAVLTLLDEGVPGSRRMVARAPGMTTVTVEALGITALLAVEVLP